MDQTWTVVHFVKENSVEAVPTTWIVGNMCYWPSFTSEKVNRAIKNHEHPDTCWESFEIRIFRNATYNTYKEASYKSKVAINTSDINADEEEESRESRKSRCKKKISSSSDESSNSDVSTPPRNDKSVESTTSPIRNTNFVRSVTDDAPTRNTKCATPSMKKNGNSLAANSQKEANLTCTCCPVHINELQMTLKTLITEIKNITKKHNIMMSVITESIDEMKMLSSQMKKSNVENIQPDSSMNKNFNFPLSSVEDFNKLEEYLSNEKQFNSAVLEIARMGGTDIYDFIKRSLSWVMKNSLLMKYTWHGTKEKSGLITTKFAQVILRASEKTSTYTDKKSVEEAIRKFLRRAKERNAYEENKAVPNSHI